jgi:hypothetical protein
MLERTADFISREAAKGLNKESGQADFTAAANKAAANLAKAGIPANVAHSVMLAGAMKGLHDPAKGNYKPTDWTYGAAVKAVNDTINAALQGYHPAKPGEVQGPYGFQPAAPTAPGQRSELGGFGHFVAGGRDVGAPPAIEPGQLPGRAEWESPLPGGIFPGLNTDLGPLDPRSEILAPDRAGRGLVIDPDIFSLQQQERDFYQQQLDPRGYRALAKGGHVAKDETVVVGEQGPEYFVPDEPGTVVPWIAGPGQGHTYGRWPKVPASDSPGRYSGLGREINVRTREAQNPQPTLMDMVDSGQLRLNAANWHSMLNDPYLTALGQSRIEDRRQPSDYGPWDPPAAIPYDPNDVMSQQLGYDAIRRPPFGLVPMR